MVGDGGPSLPPPPLRRLQRGRTAWPDMKAPVCRRTDHRKAAAPAAATPNGCRPAAAAARHGHAPAAAAPVFGTPGCRPGAEGRCRCHRRCRRPRRPPPLRRRGQRGRARPELDEAVIAFANADFGQCEQSLRLTAPAAARSSTPRPGWCCSTCTAPPASRQASRNLAPDYAQQFGWSAPQWFSLPKLVADAAAEEEPAASAAGMDRASWRRGWICPDGWTSTRGPPAFADAADAAALGLRLGACAAWTPRRRCSCRRCSATGPSRWRCAGWPARTCSTLLADGRPPACATPIRRSGWQVRLDALRLVNRADQFDETAIDYCVTYEVPPPRRGRRPAASAQSAAGSMSTRTPPMSGQQTGGRCTTFHESRGRRAGRARRWPTSCPASWSATSAPRSRGWTRSSAMRRRSVHVSCAQS